MNHNRIENQSQIFFLITCLQTNKDHATAFSLNAHSSYRHVPVAERITGKFSSIWFVFFIKIFLTLYFSIFLNVSGNVTCQSYFKYIHITLNTMLCRKGPFWCIVQHPFERIIVVCIQTFISWPLIWKIYIIVFTELTEIGDCV
jgi:hypothetical protein